ncbi:MAG: zinc ABC transporter substrate-binding protein [Candidatus Binataceae bacterium]|nr:zinc ABC transporter substrate-binding protein [Candidatus Binataceae bacterium]
MIRKLYNIFLREAVPLAFMLAIAWPAAAHAEVIKVVTTTTDLASLSKSIGGDKVDAESLVPPGFNADLYSPRPSDLFKIHRARLFIQVGLGLEDWARDLVAEANNSNLVKAQVSYGITLMDIPTGHVDYSFGDIHPFGNPHYQLDPESGRVMARNIFNALAYVDPADKAYFGANLATFEAQLTAAEKKWSAEMAPYAGDKIIPYHESWDYFARFFKLKIPETIESKPGFVPSPARVEQVIETCKTDGVRLIVTEPYYDVSIAQLISRQAGIPYVNLYIDVDGTPEQKDYISMVDYVVTHVAQALASHGK